MASVMIINRQVDVKHMNAMSWPLNTEKYCVYNGEQWMQSSIKSADKPHGQSLNAYRPSAPVEVPVKSSGKVRDK